MSVEDPADIARRLIRENLYLTLATADAAGSPWVSPVFYVAAEDERFYWVSSPEARHSRNLAERDEVSMVIFDSRVRVGEAQAVYISGRAEEVSGAGTEQGCRSIPAAPSCVGRPNGRWSTCGRLRSTGSTVPLRPRSRSWTASGTAVPATGE